MVCTLGEPVLVGVYENSELIQEFVGDTKASDALIKILSKLIHCYEISRIIYANGPGSFMGIKVAYVVLKTLSIVKRCEFYSVCGFELNEAIALNKELSFVLENGEISIKKTPAKSFKLPLNLSNLNITNDTLPNYVLKAV